MGEMTRAYLNDSEFERRYLRDHPERDSSPWAIGLAAAGIVGGGLLAFKKGHVRPLAEKAIEKIGQYRNNEVGAVIDGVRKFSEREGLKGNWNYKMEVLKMDIDHSRNALRRRKEEMADAPFITDRPGSLTQMLTQRDSVVKNLDERWDKMTANQHKEIVSKYQNKQAWMRAVESKMNEEIRQKNNVLIEEQKEKVKQTGYRFATVSDVMGHLNSVEREVLEAGHNTFGDDFLNKVYDKDLLINESSGKFADFRDFRVMAAGFMDTIADDFTTPFVKINPVRMLYMNKFSEINKPPDFHVIKKNTRQAAITGDTNALSSDHIYISGNVFNVTDLDKPIKENVRLVDGKAGPVARYYRNLAGLTTSRYSMPTDTFGKVKYNIGKFLDIGFQDEPIGRDVSVNFVRGNQSFEAPNFLDPTTWPSYLAKKVHEKTKPYGGATRINLEDAFGKDADWIVFNNYKSYEQAGSLKEYTKQFSPTTGRKNLDDVTTATLFPYGFFERLNSTLNQVGLGLSNDKLGSAFDVFKNLMLYRIAPVYVAVEGWDHLNMMSENFLGFQFEDKFAEFYAGASTDAAAVRDKLGITDWAKHTAYLFPGGDHISDLPFVGKFVDLNDSEEETRDYWENGEDAVRKGRYWEFGNTPFTGGKIEYFQPNWVRRTISDYEFTDTLYGSREEYFANTWYPTITNPLAPIRHFITDPYHYEEKHYYDRPYLATGGFTELEEFPLIGPLLNAPMQAIFKPSKQMHEEYWDINSEYDTFTKTGSNGETFTQRGEGLFTADDVGGSLTMSVSPDTVADDFVFDPIQVMVDTAAGHKQNPEAIAAASASGMLQELTTSEEIRLETAQDTNAAYFTPSGEAQVYSMPADQLYQINEKIKQKAIQQASRDAEMMRAQDGMEFNYGPQGIISPHSLESMAGNLYYNMTEMGGAYGFFSQTVTGQFNNAPTMANSTEMTSLSRSFWDMQIGNLGGDANEIFRRFLPRDPNAGKNFNPVDNTMPSWMPGEENFIDFQHGDPYTKIKMGEARLPGQAYEALYDIDVNMDMSLGASSLGRSIEQIRDELLRRDEIQEDEDKYVLSTGEDWHIKFESDMTKKGIALDFEQYMKNDELGISGFYDMKVDHARWLEHVVENADVFKYYSNKGGAEEYGNFYDGGTDIKALQGQNPDAFREFIQDSLDGAPMAILDPKTMSDYKYNQDEMFFNNVQQVNFYLHETGQKRGYLMHVNRDNIESGEDAFKIYAFDYNPELLDYSIGKVETARQHIREGMTDGSYGRGDFYDMIDRYRILSDVAPFSNEYKQMKKDIRKWEGMNDEVLKEIQEIESQASARKENIRMYDYRFKTANVEKHKVTVKEVLDNNMFITEEFDNPIKLAGVYVPTGKDDPKAREAAKMIGLHKGAVVSIAINADEHNQINDDTYQSISAVVYNRNINVNRSLIEAGLAKEKEDDFSPAAVHARFSPQEIGFGSLWERFAHLDTPYHTKFLQTRSPLESYERREVYNKDWQSWENPVEDFFIPWYENIIRKEPIIALTAGTLIGSAFGNTKFGKIAGALIGLTSTAIGAGYVNAYEEVSGKNWVPGRREEQWEMEEYLDVLKFVKYRRLYEWAADNSQYDVRGIISQKQGQADLRRAERYYLEDLKRRIKMGEEDAIDEALDLDFMDFDEYKDLDLSRAINKRLEELSNERELVPLDSMGARALMYYQKSEQTMYGYDPGEPLSNFLAGLPKKDRDYLAPFMEAPEEERDEILGVVPDYMKRVLQASYGMEVDEKPDLVEYFQTHGLPDEEWIGWDDRSSLNDLKVKLVNKEGLDKSEFEIWPDQERQAAMTNLEAPEINQHNSVAKVQERLYDVLKGLGLEEIQVNVSQGSSSESQINARIQHNRQQDIIRQMNEDAGNLI